MENDGGTKNPTRIPDAAAKEAEMAAASPLKLVPPPERRMTFREVYDAHFAYVWRLVRRFGVVDRNAEDCVQEVFIRFHQDYEAKFDPKQGSVKAFLSGYAFRVASEMRKRASNRYEQPASETLPEVSHAGTHGSVDARMVLERAFAKLSPEDRDIAVLHFGEGHPVREVAEILGKNENTCSGRVRHIREVFVSLMRGES